MGQLVRVATDEHGVATLRIGAGGTQRLHRLLGQIKTTALVYGGGVVTQARSRG